MSGFRFTPRVLRYVRRHVASGRSGPQIAADLGCDYDSLRTVCARHGVSLRRPREDDGAGDRAPLALMGRSGAAREFCFPLPVRTRSVIEREALMRGVSAEMLAAKIIELVAADDLINAVIDDGADHARVNRA